jgi:hypothetical protein
VQERLDEYYSPDPAVEEIEMLIRDSSDDGEDAFSTREKDAEGCQGICQNSNAVRESAHASPCIEQICALHRSNICFIDNRDEPS